MQQRRAILFILILAIIGLGLLLIGSVQESSLFRISTQVAPATALKDSVSGTTVTSLTHVAASNLLESPRYTGQDTQGRNWEVTASNARQEGSAASPTIVLQNVLARFDAPRGSTSATLELSARQGTFIQSSNLLTLSDEVTVEGEGITLTAPRLQAQLESRELEAGGGTRLTGTTGDWAIVATAPTLLAGQSDMKLTLTGGVHAVLTPVKKR